MKFLSILLIPCSIMLLSFSFTPNKTHPSIDSAVANITGSWVFKFNTSMGERVYDAKLKQTDNVAKGTMKGTPITIKLDGDKVTFSTKRTTFFMDMIIKYTGTVKGSEMIGTYKITEGFMSGSTGKWSAAKK